MRHRAELTEWIDEPCSYEDLRNSLRDLGRIGSITGVHGAILQWLGKFSGSAARPLRILDAGCGGGDLLRCVERWAGRRGIPDALTGIDLNPDAIHVAQEFAPQRSMIRWAVGDVASFSEPVDLIISSHFAHHLNDARIVHFLGWMERTARHGWLIHDLYRSRAAVAGFRAMACAARWHSFVREDGVTSIRRAFVPEEWRRYVEQAGIAPHAVRIIARWPVRICVSREKAHDSDAVS